MEFSVFSIISFSLFVLPIVLFVMILFIYLHKKTKEKITVYETIYGAVFDKNVLEDMKGIPPESYNYNPLSFVPIYENEKINENRKTPEISFEEELTNQQNLDGGSE